MTPACTHPLKRLAWDGNNVADQDRWIICRACSMTWRISQLIDAWPPKAPHGCLSTLTMALSQHPRTPDLSLERAMGIPLPEFKYQHHVADHEDEGRERTWGR